MTDYQRGWQEAIEAAAQHVPSIHSNPQGLWLTCSCEKLHVLTGWAESWQAHIRSLRPSLAQSKEEK
jgi:hypothetical protein